MNIFYLHTEPKVCAAMHCDKHVVKMILEYAQLLSTAHHVIDEVPSIECYKATHVNHPSAVWVRESANNYYWLQALLERLCTQYTERYGKVHKTQRMGIVDALRRKPEGLEFTLEVTPPPQCMPDEYKCNPNTASHADTVFAYRTYYQADKAYFAKWKSSPIPSWFTPIGEPA